MYIISYIHTYIQSIYASIHLMLFRASSWIQQDECHCTFEYFEAPNGQEKQPASFTKAGFCFRGRQLSDSTTSQDEALGELALEALKNQDNAAWQLRLQQLKELSLDDAFLHSHCCINYVFFRLINVYTLLAWAL